MGKVTIDGQTLDFDGTPKLLQFMLDAGLELPHFCYHPALSIPANCRQCLVRTGMPAVDRETRQPVVGDDGQPVIAFGPKLATSCSVDMADGMVVETHRTSSLVAEAQAGNLEFLLINHPLDCPICDQAGQCPLQIQAYKYGPEGSRFEFRKVHKPKRVPLGPRVMLDAERCINCTRCVRFTDEVSKSGQLTIINRGVKNYPMTPPDTTFDDPYGMNVIDLCPVGALTSTPYRFKARAWEVAMVPSITTVNAKGSNCFYWVRDNLVLNVVARTNAQANGYWLADEDRLGVERFNENRASSPQLRTDGELVETTWDAAYDAAAALLRDAGSNAAFLGSAHAPVEDNAMLIRLAESVGGTVLGYLPHVEPGHGDGWLRTDDRTPNAKGCEALGLRPVSSLDLGGASVLVVLEDDPVATGAVSADALADVRVILLPTHTTNQTLASASIVLPTTTVVETVGTYVNEDGLAQRVTPAKAIRGVNRTLMMAMGSSRTDQHGTPFDRWHHTSHKVDCRPGWEIFPDLGARLGHTGFGHTGPKAMMAELAADGGPFAGASYDAMGSGGFLVTSLAPAADAPSAIAPLSAQTSDAPAKATRTGWYEVFIAANGEHAFVLKATNGQVIMASETYTSRAGCDNGIASVQKNSALPERYERFVSKGGKPMFNLRAGNHQVIGTSEEYESEAARENGIASVTRNGPTTTIKDKTGA